MLVLRVEDRCGGGMYRPNSNDGAYEQSAWVRAIGHIQEREHPAPHEDSGLTQYALRWLGLNQAAARFGFSSLEQLRRWLYNDDWIRRLSAEGCALVTYDVDAGAECFVGHTQVIFNIRYATEVSRVPLDSILEVQNG